MKRSAVSLFARLENDPIAAKWRNFNVHVKITPPAFGELESADAMIDRLDKTAMPAIKMPNRIPNSQASPPIAALQRRFHCLALAASLFIFAGCAASNSHSAPSPNTFNVANSLKLDELDDHVRAYVDTFGARVGFPYTQIAINAKSPEERSWALQNRLAQGVAAIANASGPNPAENLLNMVVLVTLRRMVLEEYWIPKLLHEDGNNLLTAYRQSEAEIWEIAARVFTTQQIDDLHEMIIKWKQDNPDTYATGFIKFTNFIGSSARPSKRPQSVPSSLLGLLYIDPLSGLDPVAQEAHGIRLFSERLMFVATRMPIIINWQIEDATDRVLTSPQIQQVITSADEYAKIADRFNEIIAKYPADLSHERKAAIEQIDAAATRQREALAQQLGVESTHIHDILADARNSIDLARDANASMNAEMTRTIAAAEASSNRVLKQATFFAVAVILVGFLWPAVVLFVYRYAGNRWLTPQRPPPDSSK